MDVYFEKSYDLYLDGGVVKCDEIVNPVVPFLSGLQFLRPLFVGDVRVSVYFDCGFNVGDEVPSKVDLSIYLDDFDAWSRAGLSLGDLLPVLGRGASLVDLSSIEDFDFAAVGVIKRVGELDNFLGSVVGSFPDLSDLRYLVAVLVGTVSELNEVASVGGESLSFGKDLSVFGPSRYVNSFGLRVGSGSGLFFAIYGVFADSLLVAFERYREERSVRDRF